MGKKKNDDGSTTYTGADATRAAEQFGGIGFIGEITLGPGQDNRGIRTMSGGVFIGKNNGEITTGSGNSYNTYE